MNARPWRLIRRPRLLSAAVLSLLALALLSPWMPLLRALLLAFNLGTTVYLALMLHLMALATPASMRLRALKQNEGRWALLLASLVLMGVVLAAQVSELHGARAKSAADIVLAATTMLLAWLLVAVVFAQHYAHSHYLKPGQLSFPGTEQPDYFDFAYFALVVSMCCQTSDVVISSSPMRRLVALHSVVAFFFNVIIIAISVNVAASVV